MEKETLNALIEEVRGLTKEQLDKEDPDNYEACFAIAGFNHALQKVEDILSFHLQKETL